MSESGWTDDYLCTQWFEHTFIPQTKTRNVSQLPILLIYDGDGSHTTPEMRQLAHEHGIELFCLPPHTTHRTQPLDVGVFGPLQRRWMERCDDVLEETGEEIWKVDFVKEYMVARNLAFVPDTITKAWKKAGDCPLNPDIFTPADFAPSTTFSTHGHVPPAIHVNPARVMMIRPRMKVQTLTVMVPAAVRVTVSTSRMILVVRSLTLILSQHPLLLLLQHLIPDFGFHQQS